MSQPKKMKPLPWKCAYCREKSVDLVKTEYTTEINHDGRNYTVIIPDLEVAKCGKCGQVTLHEAASDRISDVFRRQLGLLTPEQIRTNREALKLTQKELARLLAIAEATLSRWETGGQIQQRALDRLLRLFFAFENVREAMEDESNLTKLGVENMSAAAGL